MAEALSAELDHEALPVAGELVHQHLGSCPDCRAWADRAPLVSRSLRLQQLAPVPDLSAPILAAAPDRLVRRRGRRQPAWPPSAFGTRWSVLAPLAAGAPAVALALFGHFGLLGQLGVTHGHVLSPCALVLSHHARRQP